MRKILTNLVDKAVLLFTRPGVAANVYQERCAIFLQLGRRLCSVELYNS